MIDTFLFAANAILPIVVIIALGYVLRRIGFMDLHFVNLLNKYVFRVGLPVLLFLNIYSIEKFSDIKFGVVLYAVGMMLILHWIGYMLIPFLVKDPNQKGVILQMVVRSNFALIGIPLAQTLGGVEAIAIVALISAFTIPLANVLSVVSLTMYQTDELGGRISPKKVIQSILSNPLIIGVFTGLIVLLLRGITTSSNGDLFYSIKRDTPFIYDALKMISQTASPMALIALGGQFEISVIKPLIKKIALGVSWRILFVPAIALSIAYMIEPWIPGMNQAYVALIALFATPAAVSSAIMVHEMGGDEQLAGQLVVWSSIFSIVTMFFIIVIFRTLGGI